MAQSKLRLLATPKRKKETPEEGGDRSLWEESRISKTIKSLMAQKQFYQTILENLPLGIAVKSVGVQHRYTWINANSARFLGKREASILSKSDQELRRPEEAKLQQALEDSAKVEQSLQYVSEEKRTYPRRKPRWLRRWISPMLNEAGEVESLLLIELDITELKMVETQAEQERMRYFNSKRFDALARMAGGLAHEINSPLMIIDAHARRLKKTSEEKELLKGEVQSASDRILHSVMRISDLLLSLRGFSKEVSEEVPQAFSLRSGLNEALKVLGSRIQDSGVELSIDPALDGYELYGKKTELIRVLYHLMLNGFDAAAKHREPYVKIYAVSRMAGFVDICILDSGPGIPADLREAVLDPFFSTKDLGKGVGMGLSYCKGVIDAHGGVLLFLDEAGLSTVVARLPCDSEEALDGKSADRR